jgi:hypothetical protein
MAGRLSAGREQGPGFLATPPFLMHFLPPCWLLGGGDHRIGIFTPSLPRSTPVNPGAVVPSGRSSRGPTHPFAPPSEPPCPVRSVGGGKSGFRRLDPRLEGRFVGGLTELGEAVADPLRAGADDLTVGGLSDGIGHTPKPRVASNWPRLASMNCSRDILDSPSMRPPIAGDTSRIQSTCQSGSTISVDRCQNYLPHPVQTISGRELPVSWAPCGPCSGSSPRRCSEPPSFRIRRRWEMPVGGFQGLMACTLLDRPVVMG